MNVVDSSGWLEYFADGRHARAFEPVLEDVAAALSLRHSLPMADSIILATAREHGATVWTLDEDFSGLDDVRYFARK